MGDMNDLRILKKELQAQNVLGVQEYRVKMMTGLD
jgi:hypothetical protein